MEGNRYELYRVYPKKLWPSPFQPTFRPSSLSSELVHPVKSNLIVPSSRCEIMDHVLSTVMMTQKFIWITLKHLQTLFWNCHTVALMIHSKRGTHLADSFFIPNCLCKIELCYVICLWPQQARALSLVDQSKQHRGLYQWFLAASIGRPERGASNVDIWPCLNLFTQLYTVANAGADVLWTLSNSALISFDIKLFICRRLITARNSFFSILQKIQRLFA